MNAKKTIAGLSLLLLVTMLYSCASAPAPAHSPAALQLTADTESVTAERAVPAEAEDPEPPKTVVLKHKGTEAGTSLVPGWVTGYLSGGIAAVEAMDDFVSVYCFISEGSNTDLAVAYETAMAAAPENGSREAAFWWMQIRRPTGADTYEDFYTVLILSTLPRN